LTNRRETLKIIGAISASCAFPFGADELYGQHVHPAPAPPAASGNRQLKYFSEAEMRAIGRIADLLIPATDTPGALAAGVPDYIDEIVSVNQEHQEPYRSGLCWLNMRSRELFGKAFIELGEAQQVAMLTPLSEAVDAGRVSTMGERFFHLIKSMTADGYYTSYVGLVQELGYKGNTVLEYFPKYSIPEH
jgi:gluconate 2-dehydrogenase gamma chain